MSAPRPDASPDPRSRARELARAYNAKGDRSGWFDVLYREAGGDPTTVPWAELAPRPALVEWLDREPLQPGRAVVIGCGLGDDAEELARRGHRVTAFDIAPTAIDWCRRRFPESAVAYVVADLFAPPADWRHAFDFVFESYTLQALPLEVRAAAAEGVAALVAPGGTVLVLCRARAEGEPMGEVPWPLSRGDLALLGRHGLEEIAVETYLDAERPDPPCFRATFVRRR